MVVGHKVVIFIEPLPSCFTLGSRETVVPSEDASSRSNFISSFPLAKGFSKNNNRKHVEQIRIAKSKYPFLISYTSSTLVYPPNSVAGRNLRQAPSPRLWRSRGFGGQACLAATNPTKLLAEPVRWWRGRLQRVLRLTDWCTSPRVLPDSKISTVLFLGETLLSYQLHCCGKRAQIAFW